MYKRCLPAESWRRTPRRTTLPRRNPPPTARRNASAPGRRNEARVPRARRCAPRSQHHHHDRDRRHYIQQRHEWVAKRAIRPLGVRPLLTKPEDACNGQHIKKKYREDYIIEQVIVEIAVRSIGLARAQCNQNRNPEA